MMTMIGVRHTVRIAEQVSFIVKHTWPDAVLVELDDKRYNAMTNNTVSKNTEDASKRDRNLLGSIAKYQKKASENNGSGGTDEMLVAINTGKMVGADIICIDMDTAQVMRDVEDNMSFSERTRFSLSLKTDDLFGESKRKFTRKQFAADEESYVRNMREKYPTLVEKLVDERNIFMAGKIKEASERYNNLVVVVGDVHVKGLCGLLDGTEIEVIRLTDMLDAKRMDEVRSRIWNRSKEATE